MCAFARHFKWHVLRRTSVGRVPTVFGRDMWEIPGRPVLQRNNKVGCGSSFKLTFYLLAQCSRIENIKLKVCCSEWISVWPLSSSIYVQFEVTKRDIFTWRNKDVFRVGGPFPTHVEPCLTTYPFQNPNESKRFFEWSQVQRKTRHRFLIIHDTVNKTSNIQR